MVRDAQGNAADAVPNARWCQCQYAVGGKAGRGVYFETEGVRIECRCWAVPSCHQWRPLSITSATAERRRRSNQGAFQAFAWPEEPRFRLAKCIVRTRHSMHDTGRPAVSLRPKLTSRRSLSIAAGLSDGRVALAYTTMRRATSAERAQNHGSNNPAGALFYSPFMRVYSCTPTVPQRKTLLAARTRLLNSSSYTCCASIHSLRRAHVSIPHCCGIQTLA